MNHLDALAENYGTERRDEEDDTALYLRLLSRFSRFRRGSVWDIVHDCEQLIHRESPAAIDQQFIRRQVALGLLSRNKHDKLLCRIRVAWKVFWACIL